MEPETFHDKLKFKMDAYVRFVYKVTKKFPKEELYGVTSQLRRSALSVVLNYIEGYARGKNKGHKNFLEISYGSLKESKYLLYFSFTQDYILESEYQTSVQLSEGIGAMLWGILRNME